MLDALSIPCNSAVEEALCFGWIDSIRKGLDRERIAQRFSPRKPGVGARALVVKEDEIIALL